MPIEEKIKETTSEMFKKMSRKGRMVLIGISGILMVKVPETITYASGFLYGVTIFAIAWISITGIELQYELDMAAIQENVPPEDIESTEIEHNDDKGGD